MDDGDSSISYAWESSMKRTWETVKEDQEGNIITTSLEKDRLKRSKLLRLSTSVRRGLIRYVVLFLDCSISARENDFKPTRFDILKKVSDKFIINYFDQNPISQLSVAITIDRSAEKITDLSGNSKVHLQGISNLMRADGLASLQNILLLAMSILRHIPDYGCREVIILYTSLSTCDSSDIFATIEEVKKMKIRCNVICLSAEIYVCKKLTEMTNGIFSVATDFLHLSDLLTNLITPPADLKSTIANTTDFIYMGFPRRQFETLSSYSYDSGSRSSSRDVILTSTSYLCPRCHCHISDIPSLCPICSLQLNSSSHIARSYHHLFPVPNYEEVTSVSSHSSANHPIPSVSSSSTPQSLSLSCYGCQESLSGSDSSLHMKCGKCQQIFCVDCDLFIHNSLHNCPGCDLNSNSTTSTSSNIVS